MAVGWRACDDDDDDDGFISPWWLYDGAMMVCVAYNSSMITYSGSIMSHDGQMFLNERS